MTTQTVADLLSGMLWNALWIGLPLLLIGLVAGVLLSLLQIVTSIQDPSFSAVPRLLVFFVSLLLLLPWMIFKLTTYTAHLFQNLGQYAH